MVSFDFYWNNKSIIGFNFIFTSSSIFKNGFEYKLSRYDNSKSMFYFEIIEENNLR